MQNKPEKLPFFKSERTSHPKTKPNFSGLLGFARKMLGLETESISRPTNFQNQSMDQGLKEQLILLNKQIKDELFAPYSHDLDEAIIAIRNTDIADLKFVDCSVCSFLSEIDKLRDIMKSLPIESIEISREILKINVSLRGLSRDIIRSYYQTDNWKFLLGIAEVFNDIITDLSQYCDKGHLDSLEVIRESIRETHEALAGSSASNFAALK